MILKLLLEKCLNEIQIKNFYITLFGDQKFFIKEASEFRLLIMISLQSSDYTFMITTLHIT